MTGAQAPALVGLLREHLRPYRYRVLALCSLQLIQTAALLYLPTVNASIIDNGVLARDIGYIVGRGVLMLTITVVQVACLLVVVRLGAFIALSVGRDLRDAVYERVLSMSGQQVGEFGTSSLVTRTVNDVHQVQSTILTGLTALVTAPVIGVGGVAFAIGQDQVLAAVVLVALAMVSWAMVVVVRRARPLQTRLQKAMDTANGVVREQVSGVKVIRAFVRDGFERRRFAAVDTDLTDAGLRSSRLTMSMLPLAATAMNLFSVPVVWIGAVRIDAGTMRIGAMTAFLGYLALILVAVTTATFTLIAFPRADVCAARIRHVLTVPTGAGDSTARNRDPHGAGEVVATGLGFRYPGAESAVLDGVDLVLAPGTTTAVTGATGSGKSTLLALLAGVLDATEGEIRIDGEDIQAVPRRELATLVGLVPQAPGLFSGTVAMNLRLGSPGATDAELWRALDVAQAREFVEAMGGLGAVLAQAGANLSGGQRQRLAIARALVLRPRVYLFDDSFSALDNATGTRLRAALAEEAGEAAVLLVSQRVTVIRDADNVVVLERGQVVGSGTHEDLSASNPVYREIVESQLAEMAP